MSSSSSSSSPSAATTTASQPTNGFNSRETREFLSPAAWNEALQHTYISGTGDEFVPRIADIVCADVSAALQSGIVGVVVENQRDDVTRQFAAMHPGVQGGVNNIGVRWFNNTRDKGGHMLATLFFK